MKAKYFEFQKYRNFDQIIEGGFIFLRQNFKPLMQMIWKVNAVYIVAFIVGMIGFYYYFFGLYSDFISSGIKGTKVDINDDNFTTLIFLGLFIIVASIVFFVRFYGTIYGYIKSYINGNGKVDEIFIRNFISKKSMGYVGLVIVSAFLLVIAFLLLIIPGIWLSIPLSIAVSAYFLDYDNVADSITKSIDYVKTKWWFSFGVIFVVGIIISLLQMVFNAPSSIYTIIKAISGMDLENPAAFQSPITNDPIMILFQVISIIGRVFLSILQIITMAILYYSLKEYHTSEGSLSKIDRIGTKNELRDN